MTLREKNVFSISLYISIFSGIVYGIFKYFIQSESKWGVLVQHPLQSDFLHIHILIVPIMVFYVGYFWKTHIWSSYKNKKSRFRKSGLILFFTLFPMIFSGYLIQTLIEVNLRNYIGYFHTGISVLFSIIFLYHQLRSRKLF